jgi:TPP-dependent pyruvate/acetoin dehydrogenase alpha subunit
MRLAYTTNRAADAAAHEEALYDRLFRDALRIRLIEERIAAIYPSDRIQSPVHLSLGQEAVAVGICASLTASDLVFGTYRSHAFYLAKGGDLNAMFAELYGKRTGCGAGKAGSMHLAAPDVGYMGSSAIVASTIPHAVGAALAAKRRDTGQVIVAVFGDGATEEGVYHESLNLASVLGLPVVFVCENNGLAIHAPIDARQSYAIRTHAASYGINVAELREGYDVLRVHSAFLSLAVRARATNRPQLLEVTTCRYFEHVGPGDETTAAYRRQGEIAAWRECDPLLVDTERAAKHRSAIEAEIDEAVAFAEAAAVPTAHDLFSDL